MLSTDVRLLSSAKLASLAKTYGLAPRGAKGIYCVRKSVTDPRTHKERTFKRSTKTADLRLAVHRASQWVDQFTAKVHGGRLPTLTATEHSTVGQICERYLIASNCSPRTRAQNVKKLRSMLEELYPDQEPAAISAELLDGKAARQWLLLQKVAAEKAFPKDHAACERTKRGANALYRQARSIFSRAMCSAYEDAGIAIPPTLRSFAEQTFLRAAEAPPSEQLSPECIAKIVRLLPRLRKVRPATWACLLLMLRGGLRNSEAVKARWSWLIPTIAGGYVLKLQTQTDYKPKAKERIVALTPDVVELLRSVRQDEKITPAEAAAGRENDPHLVPAENDNQRTIACYRGVNKFLHACGVKKHKGKIAYRLRGHAITEIMINHGMDAAQEFAGHTTRRTTELYKGAAVPYSGLSLAALSSVPPAASASSAG